ncbi:GNAT family N-acetyltransferase [Cryobacterium lactosi]|uniref:GNAT family N-acetyltransferase n=1 Tax=Cryobacterium lactosi TaxID=1259202 RepID=A0A4V3IWI3_9MICO|nr:GNAT family N-acetyltransferase [Cryobacterium lactosi]TFD85472.1 GNAT family N-acetyltransferase [Cryobacterium lactosi]
MDYVQVALTAPEVAPLLTGLRQEYDARYGQGAGESVLDVDAGEFDGPTGAFVVLLDEGTTVAGGGIRRIDDTVVEIKRMWTNPDYRRQGYASRLLRELAGLARQLGYQRVRLETGYAQPEALALYRRLGFVQIDSYGPYENATAFELSLDDVTTKPRH